MSQGTFSVADPFEQLMDYVFSDYADLDDHPCRRGCNDCMKSCTRCHQERYKEWNEGRPRYECPNIKRVYLQRLLACHVVQTKRVLQRTVLDDLSQKASVCATSVGGGPGVECLALADVLNDNRVAKLQFVNFEVESTWKPIFDDLAGHFDNILESTKIVPRFVCRDFTIERAKNLYDIVFVPWVISELKGREVLSLVSNAVDACDAGGFVVILERQQDDLGHLILEAFSGMDGVAREFDEDESVNGNCGIQFPEAIRKRFEPKFNYNSLYYVFRKQ